MLKVRKDVDLKELEKFGFRRASEFLWIKKGEYIYGESETEEILVWKDDRELIQHRFDGELDDTVYDLIKADLIVKDTEEK